MKMFTIDSRRTIVKGAAAVCTASLLSACTFSPAPLLETTAAPFYTTAAVSVSHEETVSALPSFPDPSSVSVETGSTLPPQETVDMKRVMEEADITILSRDGIFGDYSFRDCNETQLFGDYSIALASYQGEEYLMLSHNDIALLVLEDGSGARLFYDNRQLELPFLCPLNAGFHFLELYEGNFTGGQTRQLALIIPVATGSGIDVQELYVIDLDQMRLIPSYTDNETYQKHLYATFDDHFARTGITQEYHLFDYVRYSIRDGLIFVEYGACDEDNIYLCFMESGVSFQDGKFALTAGPAFVDEE